MGESFDPVEMRLVISLTYFFSPFEMGGEEKQMKVNRGEQERGMGGQQQHFTFLITKALNHSSVDNDAH